MARASPVHLERLGHTTYVFTEVVNSHLHSLVSSSHLVFYFLIGCCLWRPMLAQTIVGNIVGMHGHLLAKLRAGSWPAVQTELLVTLGQLQLPLTHPCCHSFLNVQRMHYPCFPIIIHKNTVMQLSLFSPSLKSKLTNLTRTVTRGSCSS